MRKSCDGELNMENNDENSDSMTKFPVDRLNADRQERWPLVPISLFLDNNDFFPFLRPK